jgi:hypothetical protein
MATVLFSKAFSDLQEIPGNKAFLPFREGVFD